jgi:hypothetical protein
MAWRRGQQDGADTPRPRHWDTAWADWAPESMAMRSSPWRWLRLPLLRLPLLLPLLAIQPGLAPAGAQPSEADEEANCARVSQLVEANAAPAFQDLERLARKHFGRSFAELTVEQVVQISGLSKVTGLQPTAEQDRLAQRCVAYGQRKAARESAAAGLASLDGASYFLVRWGREQVLGLGCSCPDFKLGGEDHAHGCPSRPVCPGQRGGARLPDLARGCRSLGAAAWIDRQLPQLYAILGQPQKGEASRRAIADSIQQEFAAACGQLPQPVAPPLSAAGLSSGPSPRAGGAPRAAGSPRPAAAPGPAGGRVAPAAIDAASACFANPAPASCQSALALGDGLALAAQRASRDRCLGYALVGRSLWALGADPAFTDLLINFPAASRLRNEAGIALRYLRSDCRGL